MIGTRKPKKLRKVATAIFALAFTLAGVDIAQAGNTDITSVLGTGGTYTVNSVEADGEEGYYWDGSSISNTQAAVNLLMSGIEQSGSYTQTQGSLTIGDAANITITGGNVAGGAHTVVNGGSTFTVEDGVSFSGLNYEGNAAAILMNDANVTINGATFSSNSALIDGDETIGGAIYNYKGTLDITDGNFVGNKATYGGAIYTKARINNVLNTSDVTITDSYFAGNEAQEVGAIGIMREGVITDTDFVGNKALSIDASSDGAGALFLGAESYTTITGGKFEGNISGARGGAISTRNYSNATVNTAKLDIIGTEFTGNSALTNGGAIDNYLYGSDTEGYTDGVYIDGATFTSNTAMNGGAIYNHIGSGSDKKVDGNYQVGKMYINNTTFKGNIATNGSAIYNEGIVTLGNNVTFEGNGSHDIYNTGTLNIKGDVLFDGGVLGTGNILLHAGSEVSMLGKEATGTSVLQAGVFDVNGSGAKLLLDWGDTINAASVSGGVLKISDLYIDASNISSGAEFVLFTGTSKAADGMVDTSAIKIYDSENTYALNYTAADGKLALAASGAGGINAAVDNTQTGTKTNINYALSASEAFDGDDNHIKYADMKIEGQGVDPENNPILTLDKELIVDSNSDVILENIIMQGDNSFTNNGNTTVKDSLIGVLVKNYGNWESDPTTYTGGIANYLGATATITGDTFTGIDRTGNDGGAIWNEAGGTLTLNGVTFTGNTSDNGGALFNEGSATINGGTFENNAAGTLGGAIYSTANLEINSTTAEGSVTFTGNTADGSANDIYMKGASGSPITLALNAVDDTNTISLGGGLDGEYYNVTINGDGASAGTVSVDYANGVNTLTVADGTLNLLTEYNEFRTLQGSNAGTITGDGELTIGDGTSTGKFENTGLIDASWVNVNAGSTFETNGVDVVDAATVGTDSQIAAAGGSTVRFTDGIITKQIVGYGSNFGDLDITGDVENVSNNVKIGDLTVANTKTLTNNGYIYVHGDTVSGNITNNEYFSFETDGNVTNSAIISATLPTTGTVRVGDGVASTVLTNNGAFTNQNVIIKDNATLITNADDITDPDSSVKNGGKLQLMGGTLDYAVVNDGEDAGTIQIGDGTTADIEVTNSSLITQAVTIKDKSTLLTSGVDDAGTPTTGLNAEVVIENGGLLGLNGGTILNAISGAGSIEIAANKTVTSQASLLGTDSAVINHGTLVLTGTVDSENNTGKLGADITDNFLIKKGNVVIGTSTGGDYVTTNGHSIVQSAISIAGNTNVSGNALRVSAGDTVTATNGINLGTATTLDVYGDVVGDVTLGSQYSYMYVSDEGTIDGDIISDNGGSIGVYADTHDASLSQITGDLKGSTDNGDYFIYGYGRGSNTAYINKAIAGATKIEVDGNVVITDAAYTTATNANIKAGNNAVLTLDNTTTEEKTVSSQIYSGGTYDLTIQNAVSGDNKGTTVIGADISDADDINIKSGNVIFSADVEGTTLTIDQGAKLTSAAGNISVTNPVNNKGILNLTGDDVNLGYGITDTQETKTGELIIGDGTSGSGIYTNGKSITQKKITLADGTSDHYSWIRVEEGDTVTAPVEVGNYASASVYGDLVGDVTLKGSNSKLNLRDGGVVTGNVSSTGGIIDLLAGGSDLSLSQISGNLTGTYNITAQSFDDNVVSIDKAINGAQGITIYSGSNAEIVTNVVYGTGETPNTTVGIEVGSNNNLVLNNKTVDTVKVGSPISNRFTDETYDLTIKNKVTTEPDAQGTTILLGTITGVNHMVNESGIVDHRADVTANDYTIETGATTILTSNTLTSDVMNNGGTFKWMGGNLVGSYGQTAGDIVIAGGKTLELTSPYITIEGGTVTLGSTDPDPETVGNLIFNNGLDTNKAAIVTYNASGFTVKGNSEFTTLTGTNIASDAVVTLGDDTTTGTLNHKYGEITLGDNDTWSENGTINLTDSGVLKLAGVTQNGTLAATGGTVDVTDNQTLGENATINGSAVIIAANKTLTLNEGASVLLDGDLDGDGWSSIADSDVQWYGDVQLEGGSLTLQNIIDQSRADDETPDKWNKQGKLIANSGNLSINNTNVLLGDDDVIAEAVHLTLTGDLTIEDNADATIDSATDSWTSGDIYQDGGTLTLDGVTTEEGKALYSEDGVLNIKNAVTLAADDEVWGYTDVTINEGANLTLSGEDVYVRLNGDADGNTPDVWNGRITLADGDLILDEGFSHTTTSNARYNQTGGTLEIDEGASLNINNYRSRIEGGSVELYDGGSLALNNGGTNHAVITTDETDPTSLSIGRYNNQGTTLYLDEGSRIYQAANVSVRTGTTLNMSEDDTLVELNEGDAWRGTINLNDEGATLNYDQLTSNGALHAYEGNLNVGTKNGSGTLTIDDGSYIESAVDAVIAQGATLAITGGSVTLNDNTNDDWSGLVTMDDGNLTLDEGFSHTTTHDAGYQQTGGELMMLEGSSLSLNNGSSYVKGGTVDVVDGSSLALNNGRTNNAVILTDGSDDSSLSLGSYSGTGSTLNLDDGSEIYQGTEVGIGSGTTLGIASDSFVYLNGDDTWTGTINLNDPNAELYYDELTTNGRLNADQGALMIGQDGNGGQLNIQNGSHIEEAVEAYIAQDSTLAVGNNGTAHLDGKDGSADFWDGHVTVSDGDLYLTDRNEDNISNDVTDENKTFNQTGGTTHMENSELALMTDDSVISGGEVQMTGGSDLTLDNDSANRTRITANDGSANSITIGNEDGTSNTSLATRSNSVIEEAANLVINPNGELSVDGGNARIALDGATDTWEEGGAVSVHHGTLAMTDINADVDNTDPNKQHFVQDGGTLQMVNSTMTLADAGVISDGEGNVVMDNDSVMDVEGGSMNPENLTGAGLIDSMDGTTDNKHTVSGDMTVINDDSVTDAFGNPIAGDGQADYTFDIYARNRATQDNDNVTVNGDLVATDGDTEATVYIPDWELLGDLNGKDAPIDSSYDLQFFDVKGDIADNIVFGATDKTVKTPIGYFGLHSDGNGKYTFKIDKWNPEVFRGQVATVAQYQNQLTINNILFDHVDLVNQNYLVASGDDGNKYASADVALAPYQYDKEDGAVWFKGYGNFERIQMTQDLDVRNYAYGSLLGIDLPRKYLGKGWKVLPTIYAAYNGAHQSYDNIGIYENGGQLGIMGTFTKGDFIGSLLGYAGGYATHMNGFPNSSDDAGNWFAGTATKLAYNFHLPLDLTLQPTLLASYNAFGTQNWSTAYGAMSMHTGMLNGINVAPGLNLILNKKTFSIYATTQLMFNILGNSDGKAGHVDLPNIRAGNTFFEYGLGVRKTFGDRCSAYIQGTARAGARLGGAIQGGFEIKFGEGSSKKEKTGYHKTVNPELEALGKFSK